MYAVMGVDPGKSGGVSLFLPECEPMVWPVEKTPADLLKQLGRIKELAGSTPIRAMIERVHSMPHDSGKSAMTFGKWIGYMEMALLAHCIPFDDVRPEVWMKCLGCMTKGDKNVSKAKCQALFPKVDVTHATADALLLGYYGKLVMAKVFEK